LKVAWEEARRAPFAGIDIGRMVRAAREAGLIEAGGGHAMAAGFSLMAATSWMPSASFCRAQFSGDHSAAQGSRWASWNWTRCRPPAAATPLLVREIAAAGPFGAGNPEPVLGFAGLKVVFADAGGGRSREGAAGGRRRHKTGRHRFPRGRHAAGRRACWPPGGG
jgi:single-stranded DNA-specific DHH superfamily exonuclease